MSADIILVFIILFVTVILFAFEVFPVDKIALFIIAALSLTGLVTPEEAISGFSNTATITVLSLMIIAIGMEDNGVINTLANFLKKLKILPFLILLPAFMLITASISAFISTTAVVIVFIKIIAELSKRINLSQSKLLLPISFAGILGGSCTLMGTSTNLIVNSVARDLGAERFTFFEFTLYGLVFLAVGIIVITIASKFLPKDPKGSIQQEYDLENYVTTVIINEDSELIDKRIEDTFLFNNPDASILKLTRNSQINNAPGRYVTLKKGDLLLLMSDLENLTKIKGDKGFNISEENENSEIEKNNTNITSTENNSIKKLEDKDEVDNSVKEELTLVEILILPGSQLIGRTLKEIRSQVIANATPIAIKKRYNLRNTKERLIRKDIEKITVKPGDRLLIETHKNEFHRLYDIENVAIMKEHEYVIKYTSTKRNFAFLILLTVIGLAASGVLSILISAITGVCLLLLAQCLSLTDVYHRINWQVIFLLAGMIPLGVAMHNSGADVWVSEQLMNILEGQKPMIVIGLIFLITMLMSGVISNNATAIIMTPIAIAVAVGLDLSLKPFILSVLFGANFSFFTPMGYQTNTLIYGMGFYKFKHFLIIGGILSFILWILGTFMLSALL